MAGFNTNPVRASRKGAKRDTKTHADYYDTYD
jgi:hypothetical protein